MATDTLYQQAIINFVWARQFVQEVELQRIADTLATSHNLPITPISQTIGLVNPSLNSLGFEIRNGISEDNGTQFYAMCNLRSDAGSRLATHFRAVELVFFKSIIRVIMTNKPSGAASVGEILNARLEEDQTKSLAVHDGTQLIEALVAEHWLSEPQKGVLSIGPRCLLELKQFIEEEYADHIMECTVCSDLVFKGESCVNALCTSKLHHHCARQWFHGRPRKCPTCTNAWPPAPKGWEDTEPLPPPRQFHPDALNVD